MKFNDNPFMMLLGLILVGLGIASLFGYAIFPYNQYEIIGVLAVAAFLLLILISGHTKDYLGLILTILWLLLMGAMAWLNFDFVYSPLILAVLPIGAGFFLFLGL